jgi:squalene cyclase
MHMNRTLASAIERGRRFLVARQGSDGLWRDFLTPAGEASEWPTGIVGAALHTAMGDATGVERAANALIVSQNVDGGWWYNEAVPTDADSTASVLLFLALIGGFQSTCQRAASCLVVHQRSENGGIATYDAPGPIRTFMGVGRWMRFGGWCSPHTEVTAAAGRALIAVGADVRSPETRAAWQFVRSRQCIDGSWSSYWWTSPHYATLQSVEFALSMGDHDPVGRAGDWAMRTQAEDGGWAAPGAATSAFATALSLSILGHAGEGRRQKERALLRILALQDDDGGWPSHPIMRIPYPGDSDPDRQRRWRIGGFGRPVVIQDQHRTFTSAACLTALARALEV